MAQTEQEMMLPSFPVNWNKLQDRTNGLGTADLISNPQQSCAETLTFKFWIGGIKMLASMRKSGHDKFALICLELTQP